MGISGLDRRDLSQQDLRVRQDGKVLKLRGTSTIVRRQATLPSATASATEDPGLSSTLKKQIGLAVGIPLGVILIVVLVLYWLWRRGKAKDRVVDDEQYTQNRKRRSKSKIKTATGSSSRSVTESAMLRDFLPSPDTVEPTALPSPPIRREAEVEKQSSRSSHHILGDLKNKVSLASITNRVSNTLRPHNNEKSDPSRLDRHPSNSSSRGTNPPSRHPSQRELYYQNLHVAQAKGDLPERSASPIPEHLVGASIPRTGSPTSSSIRGDPELQRPVTPGFQVATELARHDAHMRLLEERRLIAERYGQLLKEQENLTGHQTTPSRSGSTVLGHHRTQSPLGGSMDRGRGHSPAQYRTHSPLGGSMDRGRGHTPDNYRTQSPLRGSMERERGHTRTPSRQNLAQQAYQNQFYQGIPSRTSAPIESHNLDRSVSPQQLEEQQQQSRHQHQPSSGSLRPGTSASPAPFSQSNAEKPLPAIPQERSPTLSSHTRGQSNPALYEREAMPTSHRRVRSHEQSSGGRAGGQGSVRAALNELRSQGIALSPSPGGTIGRSQPGSVRRGSATGIPKGLL